MASCGCGTRPIHSGELISGGDVRFCSARNPLAATRITGLAEDSYVQLGGIGDACEVKDLWRRTNMAGTWQGLTNQPTFQTSTMILLTDGRVMVQEEATAHWHALTPDASGSYIDGSWSPLADMSFWRRYYASAVLRDGRVIVVGGEQSGDVGDTPRGEIYDPVADAWTQIPSPPGWVQVGDAASCLLPDGRLMIGALATSDCMIYDPATDSWASRASVPPFVWVPRTRSPHAA